MSDIFYKAGQGQIKHYDENINTAYMIMTKPNPSIDVQKSPLPSSRFREFSFSITVPFLLIFLHKLDSFKAQTGCLVLQGVKLRHLDPIRFSHTLAIEGRSG